MLLRRSVIHMFILRFYRYIERSREREGNLFAEVKMTMNRIKPEMMEANPLPVAKATR